MAASTAGTTGNARALAALRIGVGVFFVIFGQYKVFGTQFTLGGGFRTDVEQFLQGAAYPFMVPVLRHFILPLATPVAFLVAYGELAIGLLRERSVRLEIECPDVSAAAVVHVEDTLVR